MQSFTALEVSGTFLWPPTAEEPKQEAKGTVSVEYRFLEAEHGRDPELGTDNHPKDYHAYLRWTPKKEQGEANDEQDLVPCVEELPKFRNRDSEKVPFCFLLYNKRMKNKRLCFRGGSYYKQKHLDSTISEFPLADNEDTRKVPTLAVDGKKIELCCKVPELKTLAPGKSKSPLPIVSLCLKTKINPEGLGEILREPPNDYSGNCFCGDQPMTLLSMLGQKYTFPKRHIAYRVSVGRRGIRHWFGPLPARCLSRNGILQTKASTLVVAIDGTDRTRVNSGKQKFYLSATVTWTRQGESAQGPGFVEEEKADVEIVPEVAWHPRPDIVATAKMYTPHGLLRDSNKSADLAHSGLASVEGGLLDSALPKFVGAFSQNQNEYLLAVRFSKIVGKQTLGQHTEQQHLDVLGVEALCISLLSKFDTHALSRGKFDIKVRLPLLDSTESINRIRLQPDVPDITVSPDGSRTLLFFEIEEPTPNAKNLDAQIGGLTFLRRSAGLLVQHQNRARSFLTISLPPDEQLIRTSPRTPRLGVAWDLSLAVDEVVPERGDLHRGDRESRRLPLLVRRSALNTIEQESSPFILRVLETISPRNDRYLTCQLLENSLDASASRDTYTLLSHQPWSILRFVRTPLSQLGSVVNATVATYDSDQRFWQYKLAAPEYHFRFPPQGVGESADKPRVLELHDINVRVPEGGDGELKPLRDDVQVVDNTVQFVRPIPFENGDQKNPRRSYIVESRYSPSFDLWVRPSDLARNYFLAEWDAYELFRQWGDLGLGVALSALRGEFLYGLAVGVDPTREQGLSAFARVAEVEALTGRLPQLKHLTQHEGLAEFLFDRWKAVREALLSRHERLEVWSPSFDQARPFTPSQFSDGATFALRTTALHRAPTPPKDKDSRVDSVPGQLRIDAEQGLSGGALWPIESQAFWEALRAEPEATEGSIECIAIGPTGGDADQTAKFLKGLMTIASSTRCGFVQRQRVEILGRIGVFWNRAKHVVIYERTVNPSEQFAPIIDDGDNKWHLSRSRRAVIRKVVEYIEVLEPFRSYPDDPDAPPSSAAFLDSSRFQKIINVDSAWGNDIEDPRSNAMGYVIPLWNPGAARRRPNVYPFPNISFVTIAEGKEERPLVPRQCANPENLYFYSQASPLVGDPNAWEPVFDVDYGDLIDPMKVEQQFAAGGSHFGAPNENPDDVPSGRKPSPQRVLPGQHRFTWRLLPDSGRSMLNAGYSKKPVYGNLESITFSRGGIAAGPVDEKLGLHLRHARGIATLSLGPSLVAHQLAELKQIDKELSGTQTTATQQTLIDKIVSEFKGTASQLTQGLTAINDLETQAESILKDAKLLTSPLECGKLKERLANTINRKVLVVTHQIDDRQEDIEKLIDGWSDEELRNAWKAVDSAVNNARARLTRALANLLIDSEKLNGLLNGAQTDVEDVLGDMEIAKRIVSNAIADVDASLAHGARSVQDCLAACSNTAEWTASRYDRLREQVREELNGLALQLNSAVADLCQRLGAELGTFGWKLSRSLSSLFSKQIAKITDDLGLAISVILDKSDPKEAIKKCVERIQLARAELAEREAELRNELLEADKSFRKTIDGLDQDVRKVSTDAIVSCAIVPGMISRATDELINHINTTYASGRELSKQRLNEFKQVLKSSLQRLREQIPLETSLNAVKADLLANFDKLCNTLDDKFENILEGIVPKDLHLRIEEGLEVLKALYKKLQDANNNVGDIKEAIKGIKDNFEGIEGSLDSVRDTWSDSIGSAQAYSTRVTEGFSRAADSSLKSAPNNVLKLMAAATAAPEIGQLQANVNRMRCAYQDVKVHTTKIRATLSKLGDALKALGIDIPAEGFGDQFEIPNQVIEKFDITRLFPDFGGLNLKGLLPDVRVPKGVDQAVKISHDFDRKLFRAWVQVDARVPIAGRKELYSFGPFAVYLRDAKLTGMLRAEASKDTDETQTTARSEIASHIDVDVSGARMLSLEDTRIRYAQGKGLKFDFDPKKIRLHSALQFVQDTLGDLFGDEIGGMKIVKKGGVPIGIEHEFTLPTISMMAGTSGISNIQMSNLFRLVAYPDFVLTNRFNLSKPELPFIFSFFIVGGTGYVIIDASYRPLDQSLSVSVEVAIGGSAALGFAFGPVSGSVFISFSVAITYRKAISGKKASGEGLTVSVMLVIAGNVSLWGIVDMYLGLLLRLSYQENGAVDAFGSLSVKVKVCRFLTLRFRTTVKYRLKDGRSEKSVTSSISVTEGQRIKELKDKARRLQGART